jgi:hypothetical protein
MHKDDFGLSVLDLVRHLWYRINRIDTTEDPPRANYTQIRYRNEEVVRGENEHDLAGFHAKFVEAYAELLHFMQQLTLAHADTWVLRVVPYRSIGDRFARREYVGEKIDLGKVKVRKLRFQRHFVYILSFMP